MLGSFLDGTLKFESMASYAVMIIQSDGQASDQASYGVETGSRAGTFFKSCIIDRAQQDFTVRVSRWN